METGGFEREIRVSVELARRAAMATEAIRRQGIRSVTKKDESPFQDADQDDFPAGVILGNLPPQALAHSGDRLARNQDVLDDFGHFRLDVRDAVGERADAEHVDGIDQPVDFRSFRSSRHRRAV